MMSGQAASITATLAGQVVSEGFIEVCDGRVCA